MYHEYPRAFSVQTVMTYSWAAWEYFPRLDQKVLPRLDEYDDAIRGVTFSALPREPSILSPPLHSIHIASKPLRTNDESAMFYLQEQNRINYITSQIIDVK